MMSDMDYEESETFASKLSSFVQTNMTTLIIVLTCLVYVVKGFLEINDSQKTIQEIIFDSSTAFFMGTLLTILLGKKGIQDGRSSKIFNQSLIVYGRVIDKITPNIDKVGMYCDYKNALKLKRKQTAYLRRYGLKYELWVSGKYDNQANLTDKQKEALKLIFKKVKFRALTFEYLTSDCDETEGREEKIFSIEKFETKEKARAMLSKFLFAFVFGYFGVTLAEDLSVASVIYCAFQISIWLSFGILQYIKNYRYVTETYRQKAIIRKTNYLEEFDKLLVSKPEIFIEEEVKVEVKEVKEEIENAKSNQISIGLGSL